MAECVLKYSAATAHEAARFFCWRRYFTRFGLWYLGSIVVFIGALIGAYKMFGPDWRVGVIGTILWMNVILQVTSFFALPRAMSRAIAKLDSRDGLVSTHEDGFSLSLGGNVVKIRWSRICYGWSRINFIVLGFSYFSMIHLPTAGMTADVRAAFEKCADLQLAPNNRLQRTGEE